MISWWEKKRQLETKKGVSTHRGKIKGNVQKLGKGENGWAERPIVALQ
jgi:hypothetical protein